MIRVAYILFCVFVLVSCNERAGYREGLSRAQTIVEEDADSALFILDTLGRHSEDFGHHFKMQYLLAHTYARAKTGVLFRSDSLTGSLVNYFDKNGSCNERAMAYYMHGCALSDTGQAPEALQAFFDGISRADTTRDDCNYHILRGIYGQMSHIYHQQNLPQDEIWALRHYIKYVCMTCGERECIIAKGQLIRPYFLLGEKDSILRIIDEKHKLLTQLGDSERAVSSFGTAAYIYTERGQLQKAKRAIEIFENKSGLFDINGNIAKGREGYYFIKGYFELASNNVEQAEIYFRRAIRYGYLAEGYKGLMQIYRAKNEADSVSLFSELYESALDSLHNKMQTDIIHQMSALYNYSKSQKEAEIAREKARKEKLMTIYIAVLSAITLVGSFVFYHNQYKRKKQRIAELEYELCMAKETHAKISEELQQLRNHNYQEIIATKEKQLIELATAIEQLQKQNEALKDAPTVRANDNLEMFLNSSIAKIFIKKATNMAENVQPSEAEWQLLISAFSKYNPTTFRLFGSGKPLSKLEQRICILLILDIPEYVITLMTNSTASTISNSKARANEKLFGKKEAHPLKNNLIQAMKEA